MGYMLSHLFPLFLTFMGSFWHKNECFPITVKYLSYCCGFCHKSQVSSFKAAWVSNDNVLSNNLNIGSLTGDKWRSETNKSSRLTTPKIKRYREDKKHPTKSISGNPPVSKFTKEQGQLGVPLQERKWFRLTQILRQKTSPVSRVQCFRLHPFKGQWKLSWKKVGRVGTFRP